MLKHMNGFEQFQGQQATQLLGSLVAYGYTVTPGLGMAAGRHAGTYALEMKPSAGTAGTSWSQRQSNARVPMRAVETNGVNKWIAVGDNGVALVSADTILWQTLVLGVSAQLFAIRHFEHNGLKRWITVGVNSTIMVSDDDGISWTSRAAPLAGAIFYDLVYQDGVLIMVGANGTQGCILVSSDAGETWGVVPQNLAGAGPNYTIRYGGGRWMVGAAGGLVRVSMNNGQAWTSYPTGVGTPIQGLAYGDGVWLLPSARTIRQSADGVTWTEVANNLGAQDNSLTRIAYAPGRWIAGGPRSFLMTSTDRNTWTTRPLTGGHTSSDVTAITVSNGSTPGMVAVGTLIPQNQVSSPLIFASLAPPTTLGYRLTTTANRIVIGFAHRATARGKILSVGTLFDVDWPGALSIRGQVSTAIPIRNAWYYYELVIDKTANTVSLFVNSTPDIVVPITGAAGVTDFDITWFSENGAVARLDDIYLLDGLATDGATLVNRLGPTRQHLRMPTADVAVSWEGSAPGEQFPLVSMLPPSESSYVRSAESGAQEIFSSSTALPAGANQVLAVGLLALARKSDLDNRQLGLAVGVGPTQLEVIDTTLSITSEYSSGIFEKAPGGEAWTPENVLSTPFGVIVRP